MMTQQTISFSVPVEVLAKQTKENRHAVSKTGKPYIGRYTPKDVKANADIIAAAIDPWRPAEPLTGPLGVAMNFCYPGRVQSKHTLTVTIWLLGPDIMQWKTTRPDLDNLSKQVLDVLQARRFFKNDATVASFEAVKTFR